MAATSDDIHRVLNPEFLDTVLTDLHSHKDEWATLPVSDRLDLLLQLREGVKEHASEWVEAAARAKNLDLSDNLVSEEWGTGPYVFTCGVNALMETLTSLKNGETRLPKRLRTREDEQVIAQVFPDNICDSILMNGVTAEVWMDRGVTEENLVEHTASFYKEEHPKGNVCLVLGAGNITSICALDILYMLYAKGYVVVAKLNVVNDSIFPAMEKVWKPFIDAGYLRIVCGDVDVGKYLTDHEMVEAIHMTGSGKTHDAIVFGVGEEGTRRKSENKARLNKMVTSELGGVGAVIVVPGPWTNADIEYQAEHIATMKLHNTGCNCVAAQVVTLPRTWPKSEALVESIRGWFRKIPERAQYYPGAEERLQEAISKADHSEVINGRALMTDLDSKQVDQYAFHNEVFTTALGQTYLEGEDLKGYIENAVDFVNERLEGTLGVQLLIHPKTMKELGDEFENYLAKLKFGAIGVNCWNAMAFSIPQCTWGAYAGGQTLDNVESGIGVVHNSYLFDKSQKSVVYAPFWEAPRGFLHGQFKMFPKPGWFVTNKASLPAMKKMTDFSFDPRLVRLPGLFAAALRG